VEAAVSERSSGARLELALAKIDEANRDDPETLVIDGKPVPKELTHARMLTDWVRRLRPDASEALLLAARGHHIRRWERLRSSYPAGRHGYLRWRRDQQQFHAQTVAAILQDVGYDGETIERVKAIIQKQGLGRDPEVQAFEDGLSLVFMETQLHELSAATDEEKMLGILRKTWRKMSPAGREAALRANLGPGERALLERAASGPAGE
jgi:hypothetical protein